MRHYIIRLDDASEYMDVAKWESVADVIKKHGVKPIFGIIPNNSDSKMVGAYRFNESFWGLANQWIEQGWIPALHGYDHHYISNQGGINPVNNYSEFAGVSFEEQSRKIREGYNILSSHGIQPEIFFAPAHTYDENTISALKNETPIRCISDTVAWSVYKKDDIVYIPLLAGRIRNIPIKTATFCYHPNTMTEKDIDKLDKDLTRYAALFSDSDIFSGNRKYTVADALLQFSYFRYRKLIKIIYSLIYGE